MKNLTNKSNLSLNYNSLIFNCTTVFTPILLSICMLFTTEIQAQQLDSTKIETPQIMVLARPQNHRILLRWAVPTPKSWRKTNEYGFVLKRYTITRNNITLPQPEEIHLGTFLPKPLDNWMEIIETNNNAAIMAQAIYGEAFNVEGVDRLSDIINLSEEQEQRFTWALYSADQDFEIAQMAGLGFVDDTVKINEKYAYKITSLVPESELIIKEGGVFIGLKQYESLPKPLDLAAVFLDNKVMLSWNYAIHSQTYNNYFIERSIDGETFKRLNDMPLTNISHSKKRKSKRMFYIDSIINNKKYYYRISGKTIFGEHSPFSDVVSGKGESIVIFVPRITTKDFLDDKSVIIKWEFLEEGNSFITEFELKRSDDINGTYKKVISNISPEKRKVQYDSLQPTNYFTITAISKNGGSRTSYPALVQPVDSLPPTKPIEFKGKVDSLGIVTLNWKANSEKDIFGYRIFRGNIKNEEYSQITKSPHQSTTYYDSIPVNNLNRKVFYQLIAVDQRFNMSEPSAILEIEKPDYIPPSQPILKSYKITNEGVQLTWTKSSSEDVIKHEIYRKGKDSLNWNLVYATESHQEFYGQNLNANLPITNFSDASWQDSNIVEGLQYSYTIIAIDDNDLESDPSHPLTIIIPKNSLKPPVEGLNCFIDQKNGYIELFWKEYKQPNVTELMIYKGLNNQPILLFLSVLPKIKRIVDTTLNPNNNYTYIIRAVFSDGSVSKIAKLNLKF